MNFIIFALTLFSTSVNAGTNKNSWPLKLIQAEASGENSNAKFKRSIVIAIIDTGIDANNPALKQQLWQNPGESGVDVEGKDKATNGKDDDKNGFIDDIHGWDFISNTSEITDRHGHGSHVAGIIHSTSTGHLFKPSSSSPLRFMILKYYDNSSSPHLTIKNTISAIDYAIQNGAHIINYSGGGLRPNAEEQAALRRASAAGVLVVAAAGNEASNSDIVGYYPANYSLSNIVSVGAVNSHAQIIESSNYGVENVDIVAPGEDIVSNLSGGQHGMMTGTSQATAFVTATAGMLLAKHAQLLSPPLIINHLLQTARREPRLKTKVRSSSIINFKRSVSMSLDNQLIGLSRLENYHPIMEHYFMSYESWDAQTHTIQNEIEKLSWDQALLVEAKSVDIQTLQ